MKLRSQLNLSNSEGFMHNQRTVSNQFLLLTVPCSHCCHF